MDLTWAVPGQSWVDTRRLGASPSWYTAVRQAGHAGIVLDVATGPVAPDVTAARQAGLAVALFQGYWPAAWAGGAPEAQARARQAVAAAQAAQYPSGAVLWLDVEDWPATAAPAAVAAWMGAWADLVAAAGYLPGGYLGLPLPAGVSAGTLAPHATGICLWWRGSPAAPVPFLSWAQTAWNQDLAGATGDLSVVRRPVPVLAPQAPPAAPGPGVVTRAQLVAGLQAFQRAVEGLA